jgi:non-heme chloroperoxidase
MARNVFGVLGVLALCAADAAAQPARSVFVTTPDGQKIHCLDAGRGPAPAVLFVPGWTMPAEIWQRQIDHLQPMYRVVAMDPRAQGRSSAATEGLYPAGRASDIKAVVDELHLAPIVLVGWSMAVNEVAAYVDRFGTETLAGLVLVDGGAGFDFDLTIMPRTLRSFVNWLSLDRRQATEEFVRSLFNRPPPDEQVQALIAAALATPASAAFTLGTASTLTDNRPALAKIDRPTLIVAAAGPLVDAFRDMQRRIRGSRLVVFQNVGHALFVDEADQFNTLLEDFLRGIR